MSFLAASDIDDIKGARKALLLSALFTILVANLEFTSDQVTIFGLSFRIKEEDIVLVGRISTAFFLVVLFVHLFNFSYSALGTWLKKRNDRAEQQDTASIREIEDELAGREYYQDREPWEEHFLKRRSRRKLVADTYEAGQLVFNFLTNLSSRYFLAIFFGIVAVRDPSAVSLWLNSFSQTEAIP